MYCVECGKVLAGEMRFCGPCGAKVVVAGGPSAVEIATVPPQTTVQNMVLTEQALSEVGRWAAIKLALGSTPVSSPQTIPSTLRATIESTEGVQRIEAQGQSTFVGVMRAVAVIAAAYFGLYVVAGWIWFLVSPDMRTIASFFFLAVCSVVVIWLYRSAG